MSESGSRATVFREQSVLWTSLRFEEKRGGASEASVGCGLSLYTTCRRWQGERVKSILLMLVAFTGFITARAADLIPDFRLADVNVNSPRQGGIVSPRDYLLQISGYYFGEAH